MLRITFRDSDAVWVLEPDDEITVGGRTFTAADLKAIEIIDVPWKLSRGIAQTPDGPVEVVGFRWIDEDDEERETRGTGIEVLWPMPPEGAQQVSDALLAKQVAVARVLPAELKATA